MPTCGCIGPLRPVVLLCSLVVLLVQGLVAASASARPALPTVVQDDAQLLHRSDADTRASLERLRDLGVSTVRVTAGWSVLTRQADANLPPVGFDQVDPAAYEPERFRALDRIVRLAPQYGLSTMLDIAFWAPHWATRDMPGPRARTNVDPAAYARFAKAIARRYDGTFTPVAVPAGPAPRSTDGDHLARLFALPSLSATRVGDGLPFGLGGPGPATVPSPQGPLPKVSTFTLWNEPNHPVFLQPQWVGTGTSRRPAAPGVYRAMVAAAYPAIKADQPDATILVGGTAAQSSGLNGIAPLIFLRRLACVDEALRPVRDHDCRGFRRVQGDGWSHHPYSLRTEPGTSAEDPDHVPIADLHRLTDLLDKLVALKRIAPKMAELWLTEYGYETNPPDPTLKYSTGDQARFLTWAEYLAWRTPSVKTFAQFLLRDLPPSADIKTNSARRSQGQWQSGLAFADGRPKLASASFAAGLHVRAGRTPGTLVAWGRLRTLRSGQRLVAIQARGRKGAWKTVRTRKLGSSRAPRSFVTQGVLLRGLKTVPGGRYRLRWSDPGGTVHVSPSVAAV